MSVMTTILNIFLFPLYFVGFVIFETLWLVSTVTCIGPILQIWYKQKDDSLLDRDKLTRDNADLKVITVPGNIHSATAGLSYKLAIRFTLPSTGNPKQCVCIPNGLGATMAIIGQMHDMLVDSGFAVLSFDRLGVGFSDDNPTKKTPTAEDVISECNFAMDSVMPPDTKWIMVGPSMGSIVAQCYIAAYPNKVNGFLNMDGLPYPFLVHRNLFLKAGFLYTIYPMIIWTGILRPFLGPALKAQEKAFTSKAFPFAIAKAQLNQARFFGNISLEMTTMMDCCTYAAAAWGDQNVLNLSRPDLETLMCAAPRESVDMNLETGARTVVTVRSVSEQGDAWASAEPVDKVVSVLRKGVTPPAPSAAAAPVTEALVPSSTAPVGVLLGQWSRMAVRVMSARSHDFGNSFSNSFYTQEMKNLSSAEHTAHALLAADGARTMYPHLHHANIFAQAGEIARNVQEIYEALQFMESA